MLSDMRGSQRVVTVTYIKIKVLIDVVLMVVRLKHQKTYCKIDSDDRGPHCSPVQREKCISS